jgi:superfamily II DNA or RNA helicase
MPFSLRHYQQPLVDQAGLLMQQGRVPCIVLPTGGGKTVVLAELVRQALLRQERVVCVAHRQEIVQQITQSLRQHLSGTGTSIEVVQAGCKAHWRAQVTVGMVPTLARRTKHLGAFAGCTLFQDEAHHAAASTWLSVQQALQPARRAGLTATPVRPDGKGMGDAAGFTDLVLGPHPDELMAEGALCRYRLFAAPQQISSQGLRRRGGDFVLSDVEKRVVEINGQIVPDWERLNPDRLPTITVAVSVDHAHQLAALYRDAGHAAEAVDGSTPKGQRDAAFARFRSGETTVIVSCALIDEGLDVPSATVLQLTRPTASLRLWKQLCGRVLRPADGKPYAVIVDHTDNWRRLPLPDARIKWELNPDVQAVAQRRQLEIDPVTDEVKVGPVVEIETTGKQLQEITPELIAAAHPTAARRMFNQRFQQELTGVMCGDLPAASMKVWLQRIPLLEQANLEALGQVLDLGAGWAQAQLMLNSLLPATRLAATKQAQERLRRG